jgi:capsular polysaccharide biosynthesis protein
VLSESTAGESQQRSHGAAFRWRLTDNLFRRLGWYLLPIVIMTVIGVVQAGNTLQLFRSTGTLAASENPLVPDSPNSAATAQFFETPAGSTSRIINERLQTDTFLGAIADRAGLGDALETGLLQLDVIRASVYAYEEGDAILSVTASWADPQTSFELANATIVEYQTFLAQTIAGDAAAAVDFYELQLADLLVEREQAVEDLIAYVGQLPPLREGEERPINVEIEIDLLRDTVRAIDTEIASTEESIDSAQLAVAQQTTAAGKSFTIIDPPTVPNAPESTLMRRITLIVSFFVLGVVIAAAAVLVATVLDSSVASAADLLALQGVHLVATAPTVRFALATGEPPSRNRRWRPRLRRPRRKSR